MLIPPKYFLTPTISKSLQEIEATKEVINTITLPTEVETNIRRQSSLKSSLFSARIEGNPLTLAEVTGKPSKDQKKQEIFNLLKGLHLVHERGARDITVSYLLQLHEKVMKGLTYREEVGSFRSEVSAIFNSAGIAIYLPPPPKQIGPLIERYIKFINSDKELFIPVRACLAHYLFEKIHPFLDGNGRVGRLVLQSVMQKTGYGMKGLLTVEEYLDSHRSEYYRSLESSEKDVTDYLEFMLEAILVTAKKVREQVQQKDVVAPENFLLPRREEILMIIRDHKLVSFDLIRRRFLQINERTLRYDLKNLADNGFIRKRGTTKGVYYEPL